MGASSRSSGPSSGVAKAVVAAAAAAGAEAQPPEREDAQGERLRRAKVLGTVAARMAQIPIIAGSSQLCGTHRTLFHHGNEGEGLSWSPEEKLAAWESAEGLEAADRASANAERQRQEFDKELAAARSDAQAEAKRLAEQTEKMRTEAVQAAEEEAEQIRIEARQEMERERATGADSILVLTQLLGSGPVWSIGG